MKTRRCVYFLSVLLVAVLMLGVIPAAYADNGACPNGVFNGGLGCGCGCGTARDWGYGSIAAYSAPEAKPAAPALQTEPLVNTVPAKDPYAAPAPTVAPAPAAAPAPTAAPAPMKTAREQAFEAFILYSSMAEMEKDPTVRSALYKEAEQVWNEYLELAGAALEVVSEEAEEQSVDMNALRDEAFANSLMYAMAAEEQEDPAVQRELYLEAARIWDEYHELALSMEPAEEAAIEEAAIEDAVDEAELKREIRLEALEAFLLYSEAAEQESDPYVRQALYEEAGRIWNEYLELVTYDSVGRYFDLHPELYGDDLSAYDIPEPYDYYDAYPYEDYEYGDADPFAEYGSDDSETYSIFTDPAFWQDYAEAYYGMTDKAADGKPAPQAEPQPGAWKALDQEQADALLAALLDSFEQPAEPAAAPDTRAEVPEETRQDVPAEEAASDKPVEEPQAAAESMMIFGMPNPWKETPWLDEAIRISGVEVTLPEAAALPRPMIQYWYQAVPGTLEADYYDGIDELMIRASLDDEGYVLSGDYNVYSHAWQEKLGDVTVDCFGDGDTVNLACFKKGNVAFTVSMAIGKEGRGLTVNELGALVNALCLASEETEAAPAELPEYPTESAESAVITSTDILLGTQDPALTDAEGVPVRLVCKAETNLGDFCADAYRVQGHADIGLVNSGGLNGSLGNGVITYDDILNTNPYGDTLCVAEVTGQQLLNALEWACRMVPEESGSFYQVSGIQFEIHSYLPSPCLVDMNGNFVAIMGERRVQNVLVGGEPLDPAKTYTVAASDYVLLSGEDGNAALADAKLLKTDGKLDVQLLIDYIIDDLHGVIGEEYADLNGQGRIILVDTEPQPEQAEEETPAMPDAMQRHEGKRPHFDGKKK